MPTMTADDGVEIAYETWGERSTRPPVVLQHGFIADAKLNWVLPGIVGHLIERGFPVVALDARGHGGSGKPTDPACYGEARMARDLLALVDELGAPEVDLVGYSMGAIVCLIAASHDPRVRRLVTGGVGAAVVELGGVDTRVLDRDTLVQALEAESLATLTNPQAVAFRLFADTVGADRRALAAHARVVHASPIELDRITAPTLVIAGDRDELAARPQVLADAIPNARVELMDGDHLTALNDPRLSRLIADFLVQRPSDGA
jgi:pimeloyl-ACP methyl ester carboxylesterase